MRFYMIAAMGTATMTVMMAASYFISSASAQEPPKLRVMSDEYPRAFFFRMAEGAAAQQRTVYADWDRSFSRLMGIMGKALEEEIPGRSARNPDFFTRFKKAHPDQVVLLHCNGNARDPRWESARFFAGHWLYFNGTQIVSDVPAESGETNIRVSDSSLFKAGMGRYENANEDVGLCALDAGGRPDWRLSEQVQLISVDPAQKTIRVKRGAYGTAPRAFASGKAYAAAHCTEGPWGKNSNLLWAYNYSTRCPRDTQGHSCGDIFAQHLAELFSENGPLAAFDGLEFDVLHNYCPGGRGRRSGDCDADGKSDGGYFGGVNEYGKGVVEFSRALRQKMGDKKIIQADGVSGFLGDGAQRAFGIFNGIESEGWPSLNDPEIRDWSGGLNRHFFWDQNARPPVFNYINHKYVEHGDAPADKSLPDVPFKTHRLVFAVACFTNSAICYSFPPKNDAGGMPGIWDELRMGAENRLAWLGKPMGPAMRLAAKQPDLLKQAGAPVSDDLLKCLSSDDATFELKDGAIKMAGRDPNAEEFHARLRDVPCDGPELTVFVTARAEPVKEYPPEMARIMYLSLTAPGKQPAPKPATPKGKRAQAQSTEFMTHLNQSRFMAGFYFNNAVAPKVDIEFRIEGAAPVWIERIAIYAHADAIYREFEHGLVLANPSPRPYTFEIEKLLPGKSYRRLKASANQDTKANDGSPVGGRITLEPLEGLFLSNR